LEVNAFPHTNNGQHHLSPQSAMIAAAAAAAADIRQAKQTV